ncbi:MAG: hypothetical protein M1448_02330 [Candidatus Marsarchaeota archaeon]|nr:hypothetical protein [Candidatus Marsarchaeota archaeon]
MSSKNSNSHAQSAFEYLVTYGWALLILALVLVILFYFTSVPSKVVPNTCQFTTGAFCEDIVLGSVATTHATVVAFISTNMRKYPVMNPALTIVQNGVNSTPVACSPDFVLPGGAIFCEVNTQIKSNPYQFVASSIYLSAVYCGFSATPGTPAGCANGGVRESYSGSFAGSTQPVSSTSLLSISLSAANPVQPANGSADALTATVKLQGYPVTGASVGFNATYASNGTDALPPFALKSGFSDTNSTGVAIDSIWGSVPGNLTVTASYGNHSASVPIRFIPSVEVRFVPSNSLVANFSNCTTPIVSIDKTNYTLSEVAAKVFNWTVGTTHPFAFTTPFCASSGSTKRGIFKSATVYGVTQPTPSGNITATTPTNVPFSYQQQYYLTTASNPALAGIVSPASGWYNSTSKVTITETSNNSSTTREQFINWTCTGTGCYSGTNATATITMDSPITETANYQTLYYFSESASPSSGGVVSPGSEWVEAGNTITISETPSTTTQFSGWSCTGAGCYQGPSTSATITINNPVSETANYFQGYMYCPQVGELIPTSSYPTYFSKLLDSGIAGWAATSTYPNFYPSQGTTCVSYSGYVYCVGGEPIIFNLVIYASTKVDFASLSTSGVGGWVSTTNYPYNSFLIGAGVAGAACVVSEGYIYCVDGALDNVGGYTQDVYYAPLSASGVGAWQQTSSYPFPGVTSCATSNGYIYCVGGYTNGGNINSGYLSNVYYASISSSGVGAWQQTSTYPIPDAGASCTISNGYIYCIGGYNGGFVSNAYYAPISSSGVGAWQQTSSYPEASSGPSCIIANGYIYCVSGQTSSSSFTNGNVPTYVYYAPISNSGIGGWSETAQYPLSDITTPSCVEGP